MWLLVRYVVTLGRSMAWSAAAARVKWGSFVRFGPSGRVHSFVSARAGRFILLVRVRGVKAIPARFLRHLGRAHYPRTK